MNEWSSEVKKLIESTGMSMRAVAEKTEVPYRTIQDWKSGARTPDRLSQIAFRTKIVDLNNRNNYWFRNDILGNDILCRNAESVEDAIAQISQAFNVVEVLKSPEISKTTHNSNDVYVIYHGNIDTRYAVVIDR